jgi:hypothetical protein
VICHCRTRAAEIEPQKFGQSDEDYRNFTEKLSKAQAEVDATARFRRMLK